MLSTTTLINSSKYAFEQNQLNGEAWITIPDFQVQLGASLVLTRANLEVAIALRIVRVPIPHTIC